MMGRRRSVRFLMQAGPVVLGNWAMFAILSIWASVDGVMLAVAILAFAAGATLGVLGVVTSPLAVAVIAVCAELTSSDPLSAHRFLVTGLLAIFLLVLSGLAGYALRVLCRRLDPKGKKASLPTAVKTP